MSCVCPAVPWGNATGVGFTSTAQEKVSACRTRCVLMWKRYSGYSDPCFTELCLCQMLCVGGKTQIICLRMGKLLSTSDYEEKIQK